MSTQHLVVQTHPSLKGALMVDTLLYNKADYLQPFPDILLVFRDINERVIASRRFTPKQFLSGELAGQSDMSPQSRTHIALEIVDPGPDRKSTRLNSSHVRIWYAVFCLKKKKMKKKPITEAKKKKYNNLLSTYTVQHICHRCVSSAYINAS